MNNINSMTDGYVPTPPMAQHGLLRALDKVAAFGHKACFRLLPKTFISFLLVGALGVVVHMFVLKTTMWLITPNFSYANCTAMIFAATFNYVLNNKSTFHKDTLSGRKIIVGYVIYLLITSVGLASSLAVSTWVFNRNHMPMAAALCGIIVGAVWNYLMSYTFVWKLLSKIYSSDK
jgi:putative flippase GtrA